MVIEIINLINDPWWVVAPQWIIAFLTFIAIFVALFGRDILNWKNKPKILFGLSNIEPCVKTIYGGNENISKYFRIKVINIGNTVAKNCQIKLISVIPEKRKLIPTIVEPDKLKWSNAPLDRRYCHDTTEINRLIPIHRERIDISPKKGWEFCDLFQITSGNNFLFLSLGARKPIFKNENYIITIEISGENLKPRSARLKISNPNSFEKIRISWI